MEMKKRLLATKVLVILSLVASVSGLLTVKMKWGEPYPFSLEIIQSTNRMGFTSS
jgi:hypothetical protein